MSRLWNQLFSIFSNKFQTAEKCRNYRIIHRRRVSKRREKDASPTNRKCGLKKELSTSENCRKFVKNSELFFLKDNKTLYEPVYDKERGIDGDLRKIAVEMAFFDQNTEDKRSSGEDRGDKRKILYEF